MAELQSISVIIPTYDEPERLCQTLASLAAQDYPGDRAQVVVVDDGSPAFPEAEVRTAAGPNLRLLRNPTNQGRARSRNRAIEVAEGELVVFLDSDMTVPPHFLHAHARIHAQQTGREAIGNIRFSTGIDRNALTRYIDSRGVHRLAPGEPVPFKCFVTGNSSLERQRLLEVGLFDEDFRHYGGEDLELGYRLHLAGLEFAFAEEALSLHNHLRTFGHICRLMRTYGQHSLPLLLDKHPELADLLHLGFLGAGRWSPRRWLYRLLLAPAVYTPIQVAARLAVGLYVPDRAFEYIW